VEKQAAADEEAAPDAPATVAAGDATEEEHDVPVGFWEEVGIDPIRITTADGEYVTLRCYLDDAPVFLGTDGTIEVFASGRALARWVGGDGAEGHDIVAASTWSDVVAKAGVGELEVEVDDLNAYTLAGLDADLAAGITAVDGAQLELATELLLDVGEWAGDDEPREALADSQSLGWLVSFIIRPDPTRLAPSPPFAAESARFGELVDDLQTRLHPH
jgi:hypothetical protein